MQSKDEINKWYSCDNAGVLLAYFIRQIQLSKMSTCCPFLKSFSIKMAYNILDTQHRSMTNNIIIHVLPEESQEMYQTMEQLVRSFMKDSLKME